ncbi:hypothetical protein [Deinococcus arcticus]|uniref:Lipoprotein n=1 Tax=Deinococcus arcticus TaxID=2136176 RepID=A0A2T3W9U4_9DEIO|nr:hypothetical protein [Deinococcus arcticus]PTA68666.1 hypothetical protein C8263_05280 [Deinococcus arcticus]
MRALFLLPALFLAACAPAASTSTSTDLKGPLVEGERWTITGFDQNRNKMEGEVVVPTKPDYLNTTRKWVYRSGSSLIFYTESTRHFEVQDLRDPLRLLVCIVRQPYDASIREYAGISVSGARDELDAVFAKLSGSDGRLVGGNCTLKREVKT